jgi:hypothetical protein
MDNDSINGDSRLYWGQWASRYGTKVPVSTLTKSISTQPNGLSGRPASVMEHVVSPGTPDN